MQYPVQLVNATLSTSGDNVVITNPDNLTFAPGTTNSKRAISVVRWNVENNSAATVNVSFKDSISGVIEGPFTIPASQGDWTERASIPAFLFQGSHGGNLIVNISTTGPVQVVIEYFLVLAPGVLGR